MKRSPAKCLDTSAPTLAELQRDRGPNQCAMCLRPMRRNPYGSRPRKKCARADCASEYERLYQADRRDRRRRLEPGMIRGLDGKP